MKRVYIDPGHGGDDNGIIADNLIEKNIVLNIALNCREMLLENNIEVELSREDDSKVELEEKVSGSSEFKADYYIAIHCNEGYGDRGEIIYSSKEKNGLKLARRVGDEMNRVGQRAVKIYNRVNEDGGDYYDVIRETKMDSIIIECAYLDHETNKKLVEDEESQKQFGYAIAKAIIGHTDEE